MKKCGVQWYPITQKFFKFLEVDSTFYSIPSCIYNGHKIKKLIQK